MWPFHEQLLRRSVPRYTSYPTAAEFNSAVTAEDYSTALSQLTKGVDVSIYVHIPFCQEICWYCGCNTARANGGERKARYLDALHDEIDLISSLIPEGVNIRRIAFGGGSPNSLTAVEFARIVDRIIIDFGSPEPLIAVELDPRHVTTEWIRTIATIGVQNVSLGVQTFDPVIQKAIGRVQPYDLVHRLFEDLRTEGVRSINFDLIYGLPGQNQAKLADTILKTIDMKPDRIALFGYAHLPSVIKRQKRINSDELPSLRTRFAQSALGFEMLSDAGYIPIGFDHFALPNDSLAVAAASGSLHRNFQGYTDDDAPVLIGLGASAISELPGLLVQNAKNYGHYASKLLGSKLASERGVFISPADNLAGTVIEGILCRGEAQLPILSARQQEDLRQLEVLDIVRIDDGYLKLKDSARPYARMVAEIFDTYRTASVGTFSTAI